MSSIDNWKPSPEGMRRIKDEHYAVDFTIEWAEDNVTSLSSRAKLRKNLADIRKIIPRGSSTLDVGCGGGLLVTALASLGYRATGYDSSPACLEYSASYGRGNYINTWPISGKFDFVSAIHVLEHVENPQDFLKSIYGILKKNGKLYIIVPNLSTIQGIFNEQYKLLIFDVNHKIAWNYRGLKDHLQESGFTITSIKHRIYFGLLASIVASKLYRNIFRTPQTKMSDNKPVTTRASLSAKVFRLLDYLIPPLTVTGEKEHRLFEEIIIEARK